MTNQRHSTIYACSASPNNIAARMGKRERKGQRQQNKQSVREAKQSVSNGAKYSSAES